MPPKVSEEEATRAKGSGGKATQKLVPRDKPKDKPAPDPGKSTTQIVAAMIKSNATESEKQRIHQEDMAKQIIATIEERLAFRPSEPMRLKVHRDMDRQSPTYLLTTHIDIIPIKRKLDS